MSTFSRKHYEMLAATLGSIKDQYNEEVTDGTLPVDVAAYKTVGVNDVVRVLAEYFKADNPLFDTERFITAAASETEVSS